MTVYGQPAAAASGVCDGTRSVLQLFDASGYSSATLTIIRGSEGTDDLAVGQYQVTYDALSPGQTYSASIGGTVFSLECQDGLPTDYSYTASFSGMRKVADPAVISEAAAIASTLFYGQYGTLLLGLVALVGIVTLPLLVVRLGVRRVLAALRKMVAAAG